MLKELGNTNKNGSHFCINYNEMIKTRVQMVESGSLCLRAKNKEAECLNEQDKCSKVAGPQRMTYLTEP